MAATGWKCYYCNRILRSERGRTQHINASPSCRKKQQDAVISQRPDPPEPEVEEVPLRRSKRHKGDQVPPEAQAHVHPVQPLFRPGEVVHEEVDTIMHQDEDDYSEDDVPPIPDDEEEEEEEDAEEPDNVEGNIDKPQPNLEMRAKFMEYVDKHSISFAPFTKAEITQIRLLDALKRKRAPLNAYQELLEWHLKEKQHIQPHMSLKDTPEYSDREAMMQKLMKRYNLEGMIAEEKKVRLPFSRAHVTIPCVDVKECIVSLLTDPRFQDEDYLFFNDNPLQKPPEQVTWIQDLNTGEAHLKTYERLVTDPERQILLPIIMYIDGATTGQFSHLPVTALKIALGIHKRTTRDKPYAWKDIAYLPQVRKQPARGKKLFKESGHLDSQDVVVVEGEGDSADEDASEDDSESEEAVDGAPKAQDLHSMLRVALKSFVKLQKTGFIWDFKYKNKTYKDVEFIIYVPFVKCDTEEGDLLCGKYLVRTGNVAQLCRYCHCPTADADNPRANYKLKTQKEIERLVNRQDLDALKAMSQQCIRNAFYSVRFHGANECGIHGATPSEMLHALLLGLFKYARDIFFDLIGPNSQLAQDIDGLAKMYGKLIDRQSDRDLPHTNFNKGIMKGKLMAKQYRGLLLVIAAVLASTKGRAMLLKKKGFGGEQGLKDWTLLVEMLLEWEAYLTEPKMKRAHVIRLAQKHRYILYIMTVVANRTTGMGLKLMKFHAVLHLVTDIILYGVPTEFDTGSNESHHKPTKQAAKMTQRNEVNFNQQTATRLLEFLAIDLAVLEVDSDIKPWEYYYDYEDEEANVPQPEAPVTKIKNGGTRLEVFLDPEEDNAPSFRVLGKSKHADSTQIVTEALEFIVELQELVANHTGRDRICIFTEHKRDGVIFRGHPNYHGSGPWKDWVLVDWGNRYGKLPCRIWCFVDLVGMPSGKDTLQYGGIHLRDGVYAVVEYANYEIEEPDPKKVTFRSELFVPLVLDVEAKHGEITRKFFLADTDAFVEPVAVVPDIGGDPNRYFVVKSRSKWVKEFIAWLEAPHNLDVMDDPVQVAHE